MKKLWGSFICLAVLIWGCPVFAFPALQLDIGGGYYNTTGDPRYNDATIVSTSDHFTLYTLMAEGNKTALADDYYVSMALYQRIPLTSPSPSFGSFTFQYQTIQGQTIIDVIDVVGDMIYGNPGIPEHGVFDTYYKLYSFKFNAANQVGSYDVQKNPGQFEDFYPGNGFYYESFVVDTTNLSDDVSIHFDLFNNKTKAPFSHDADAQSDPPPVPEPATMLLLGLGLVGLAGISRKIKN